MKNILSHTRMTRVMIIILSVITGQAAIAQQTFQHTLFRNQLLGLNPAIAGTQDHIPLALTHRSQWVGLEGAPSTQVFTVHGPATKKAGLGLTMINDQTGPAGTFSIQLSYAWKVKLTDTRMLSFGLAPALYQFSLDKSKLTTDQAGDPLLNGVNQKSISADVLAGVYFYDEKIAVGFSVPNLLRSEVFFGDALATERLPRHFILTASYSDTLNATWRFNPLAIGRYTPGAPAQGDLTLRGVYKETAWLGLGGRASTAKDKGEALLMQFGLDHGPYSIGYSYDYTLSTIGENSGGSHEILLRYRIPLCGQGKVRKKKEDDIVAPIAPTD